MAYYPPNKHPGGQLLVEILITIGLVVVFVGSFSLFAADASRIAQRNSVHLESKLLGQEAQAALQMLWFGNPAQLTIGAHGLLLGGNNEWQLTATPDTHGSLIRTVIIEAAERDAQGSLAVTGTADPETKKITTRITHQDTAVVQYENTMFFPTIEETPDPQLQSWRETTRNDFNDGSFIRTRVTNTNGGEVTLRNNQTQGIYTSSRFDTGSATTTYSHIVWNGIEYAQNEIRIHLRVAQNNGQLNQATWFGPDGTDQTFFQSGDPITIPPGVTGTRRVQYRIEFIQTTNDVPLLSDIEIFYAP